jgi:transposase
MNTPTEVDQNLATYVGIDVHPASHTAFAMNRFEETKGSLRFENTHDGIRQFLSWLGSVDGRENNIIVGVEGRGGNGHALVGQLLNTYDKVYEVNPLYTKHRRSFGTRQEKTDERDAKLIAEVLTRKLPELPTITRQEYRPQRVLLKKTVEFYDEATFQRTRLKNQLHRLQRELSLTTNKQENHILAFVIKEKQAELKRIAKRQKEFVEQFEALLEENGKNLTTFRGVNTISAARIASHTNGIERFHSLDSFIRYAGIGPVERSSGKTTRYRQNLGGNRQLNNALYIVALSHLRWDPKGKAYFEKKVKEGKTKKHAIRCLMQRIACIIYAMLKNGEEYRG